MRTRLHILFSLAYWTPRLRLLQDLQTSGVADILLDCGAFTAHCAGKEMPYSLWKERLLAFGPSWGYIALDVIGDPQATDRNLDRALSEGLSPIPVLTTTAPVHDFPRLASLHPDSRVCLAGGRDGLAWYLARARTVSRLAPHARIHGLAFSKWPEMFHAPIASVDSSSFIRGQKFGTLDTFLGPKGLHTPFYRAVRHLPLSDLGPLRAVLLDSGITEKDWRSPTASKGSTSISMLLTMAAHIRMAEAARRHGILYFFSISNISQAIYLAVIASQMSLSRPGIPYHSCVREIRRLLALLRAKEFSQVSHEITTMLRTMAPTSTPLQARGARR